VGLYNVPEGDIARRTTLVPTLRAVRPLFTAMSIAVAGQFAGLEVPGRLKHHRALDNAARNIGFARDARAGDCAFAVETVLTTDPGARSGCASTLVRLRPGDLAVPDLGVPALVVV
jgi:hypothetical protein